LKYLLFWYLLALVLALELPYCVKQESNVYPLICAQQPLNSSNQFILSVDIGSEYIPSQDVAVNFTSLVPFLSGLIVAVNDQNETVGQWTSDSTEWATVDFCDYTWSGAVMFSGTFAYSGSWEFRWESPPNGTGTVSFIITIFQQLDSISNCSWFFTSIPISEASTNPEPSSEILSPEPAPGPEPSSDSVDLCSQFIQRNIQSRNFYFSNIDQTWDDASDTCSMCFGTELANITRSIVFSTETEISQRYWIGGYATNTNVSHMVWETGPNPRVLVYAPSQIRRRFICNSHNSLNRCIYVMEGNLHTEQRIIPWINPTSMSSCWSGVLRDGYGSFCGDVTHCILNMSSLNLRSSYWISTLTTMNISNSETIVLLLPVTISPLLYMTAGPSRFTHLSAGYADNFNDTNGLSSDDNTTGWGVQSKMGTGRFLEKSGISSVLGFLNLNSMPSYQVKFEYLFVVDWEEPVRCY
jgi:hypothetical protein